MDIKHTLNTKQNEIRCFNIISKENKKNFGLKCGRLLLMKNSDGKAAGKIKCSRCGAIYEIKDGYMNLIDRGGK